MAKKVDIGFKEFVITYFDELSDFTDEQFIAAEKIMQKRMKPIRMHRASSGYSMNRAMYAIAKSSKPLLIRHNISS